MFGQMEFDSVKNNWVRYDLREKYYWIKSKEKRLKVNRENYDGLNVIYRDNKRDEIYRKKEK